MTRPSHHQIKALTADLVIPDDPARRQGDLQFYADGTPVVMRWAGGERHGHAAGMAAGNPYDWQLVQWTDGTRDKVAPHVLHRGSA